MQLDNIKTPAPEIGATGSGPRPSVTNDDAELERLLSKHSDLMYRIALGYTRNSNDAEDVVQETLIQILKKGAIEDERIARPWIARAVLNNCRLKYREENRRARREGISSAERNVATVPDYEKSEVLSAALKSINELPETYRWPVWLHYLEGLSYEEIASVLSIKEKTVRQQARRGLEKLRESLTAAGFTTTAVALPALLSQLPLPSAPSMLCARSASAAGKAAARKALSVSAKTKRCLAFAGAVCLVLAFWHFHSIPAPRAAAVSATPPNVAHSPLERPIDFDFWREYPEEALAILEVRSGLECIHPPALDKSFAFTFSAKGTTAKAVLEKLAADGGLELEYQSGRVLVWKPAGDVLLQELAAKLHSPDRWTRCDAAWELGKLGDKRIYPLLLTACEDSDAGVPYWALRSLDKHAAVLPFIDAPEKKMLLPALRRVSIQGQIEMLERCRLMGASSLPEATAAIAEMIRKSNQAIGQGSLTLDEESRVSYVRCCAVSGLSYDRDSHAIDMLLNLADEATKTDVSIGQPDKAAIDSRLKLALPTALARCKDPRSFSALVRLMESLSDGERKLNIDAECLVALSQMRTDRAAEYVANFCNADSSHSRRILSTVPALDAWHPLIADALARHLQDGDSNVRRNCILTLSRVRDRRVLEPILDDIARGTDAYNNNALEDVLAPARDPRAEAALLILSRKSETHWFADNIPSFPGNLSCGNASLEPSLQKKLEHSDLSAWKNRGKTMLLTRDPEAVDALFSALRDNRNKMDVRLYAARGLAEGLDNQNRLTELFDYMRNAPHELFNAATLENCYWKALDSRLSSNLGWLNRISETVVGHDQSDCITASCSLVLIDSPQAQRSIIRAIGAETPELKQLGAGLFDPRRIIEAISFLKTVGKPLLPAFRAASASIQPGDNADAGGAAGKTFNLHPGWANLLNNLINGADDNYRKTALYLVAWIQSPQALRSTIRALNGEADALHEMPSQVGEARGTENSAVAEQTELTEPLNPADELAAMFHSSLTQVSWEPVVHGMSRARDQNIVDALLKRLNAPDESALADNEKRCAEIERVMEELILDPEIPGRMRVGLTVDLFRHHDDDKSAARLLEQVDSDPFPWDERQTLICALESSRQPSVMSALLSKLSDKNVPMKVREEIAATLNADRLSHETKEALLAFCQDASMLLSVRVRATVMLAGYSAGHTPSRRKADSRVIGALIDFLTTSGLSDELQRTICEVLANCGDDRAHPALIAALQSIDMNAKQASAISLAARYGDKNAVATLLDVARHGTTKQKRAAAAVALQKYVNHWQEAERSEIDAALNDYEKTKDDPETQPNPSASEF